MSCFVLTSCGDGPKDEPNNQNNPNNSSETSKEHPYTSKLKGTSWHIDRITEDGETIKKGNDITDFYFTDQPYNNDVYPLNGEDGRFFIGYVNFNAKLSTLGTNKIAWRVEAASWLNGAAYLRSYLLIDNDRSRQIYEDMGWYYGVSGEVFMLSASSLVVGPGSGIRVYFTPSEWREGRGSGDGGDSSYDYEKPDIGLESYDCYTNSIIAYYRIYNPDEAKVTSAKGYYGTSSASGSVNATILGQSLITIKFSDLKANTTYYIKCTATGKGGSESSETTRLSTTD